MIANWNGIAFNQSPNSANQIHGDEIAQKFGFKGGLVPGVTISSYLLHPAVEAWGLPFLARGQAHVRVGSPLYDEEAFSVEITSQADDAYSAQLVRPDGSISATAEVTLPEMAAAPPTRRGDPLVPDGFKPPVASVETFERLQADGCLAFPYHWGPRHNMKTYLRDDSAMPALLRGDTGYANMAYILGISNWVLSGNAHMNPWVHLETRSQNYAPVAPDTRLVAEMVVAGTFEKKGHEFVDADVHLFNEADDSCVATISLRAIYRLRGL